MKQLFYIFLFGFLFSCSSNDKKEKDATTHKPVTDTTETESASKQKEPTFTPLTENAFKKKELVVLLNNSSFSYLLYKGRPLGYEYELLKMFCEDNDMMLKIKVVKDAAHILDSLKTGHGHIAAANFTINTERKKENNFTLPFFKTRQILVQPLPAGWRNMTLDNIKKSLINDPLDLDGKKIMVKSNSVFSDRLKSFAYENGLNIDVQNSEITQTTEDLIDLVDKGDIDFTVADQNTTNFYEAHYNNLDFNTAISFNQNIAWAVNKSQPELLTKVNEWIKKNKGGMRFNILQNRYFSINRKDRISIQKNWQEAKNGEISPFDNLIKEHAKEKELDWLLLTSLIFQESKFNPRAKSWVGALGLTQVMPATAKDLGINNPAQLYTPSVSVRVGSKYFKQLVEYWRPVLKDSVEANYFALASYNAGKGHVLDARRIALKSGKDQNKWFGNVEQAILLKSNPNHYNAPHVKYGYCIGKEPVQYVKNIREYYETFKMYLTEKGH